MSLQAFLHVICHSPEFLGICFDSEHEVRNDRRPAGKHFSISENRHASSLTGIPSTAITASPASILKSSRQARCAGLPATTLMILEPYPSMSVSHHLSSSPCPRAPPTRCPPLPAHPAKPLPPLHPACQRKTRGPSTWSRGQTPPPP